ncbi:putative ATP-dependent RNA helicase DDX31 [Frankliniella fusca]|uniref:ATP-dependent RNA helicase n=1 Tax=Frankliniella fusca TaxID=407009 RepID=A0AAE1GYV9_9NEOP|nr:putative ATP-dependent RNA helicase DDX31 [Frankliniella fusca]
MSELALNIVSGPVKTFKQKKRKNLDEGESKPKIFKKFKGVGANTVEKKPFKRKDDSDSDEEDTGQSAKPNEKPEVFPKKERTPGPASSLFRSNPEVPFIEHKDVKPVSEHVFSSELIKDMPIHPHSVANLEKNLGMTKVTTVQKMSFPVIMSGKDTLVRSQTGSGKTIAYALPIVESLQSIRPKLQRSDGVQAIIIVPTRELALQTYECFIKLVKPFTWIVPGYLVGGEKKKSEKARLRKGISILIGTPGRLLDHIEHTKSLLLYQVRWLVIDEADRLLDMGYERDVASLVRALNEQQFGDPEGEKERFHPLDVDAPEIDPKASPFVCKVKRQTIMLSATMTSSVDRLAGLALKHPKFVDAAVINDEDDEHDIALIEQDLVIPDSLTQWYLLIPAKLRLVTLASFIVWKCRMTAERKMLIFMATQDMVDFHTEMLTTVLGTREKKTGAIDEDSDLEDEYGLLKKKDDDEEDDKDPSMVDIEFFKLHGNMTQKERTDVFKTFRSVTSGVLLCTDVAARGLDLPMVDWIVQYTAPATAADYVHRVGRTARVGAEGSSMIMLCPSEAGFINQLEERRVKLFEEGMERTLQNLVPTMAISIPSLLKMRNGATELAATKLQLRFEDAVAGREDLHHLATKAYVSFVRFYASYPHETRGVFNFKALHLGHYAKSFALRDPPSKIGGLGKKQWLDRSKGGPGQGGRGRSGPGGAKQGSRPAGHGHGPGPGAKPGTRPLQQPRPRGGPGSSRGLAGGRGTGKSQDGKPGSGGGGRPFANGKPSAFGAKSSAARTSRLAVSEFSSGLQFKKKKKQKKDD